MPRSLLVSSVTSVALLVGVYAFVALSPACANVDRGLGEACIRDSDCLSDVCAGQVCVAQPAFFDATPPPVSSADAGADVASASDAVSTFDASSEAGLVSDGASEADAVTVDASDATVSPPDVNVPETSAVDAHDADPTDVHDTGPIDAPTDTHPKAG